MLTRIIIDGVLSIAQVIRYNNRERVARLYDPRATTPHAILNELQDKSGVFRDEVNHKDYQLTPTGFVGI